MSHGCTPQLQQQPMPTLPQQTAALPLPPQQQQPVPQQGMQFYDTNQEFLKPVARPQAYRQNTAQQFIYTKLATASTPTATTTSIL